MLEEFDSAPMSQKTRAQFADLVERGDCDGILSLLDTFIRARPDVGESIQRHGQVSFESRHAVVRALWEAWRLDMRTRG
jgi:hypothetical protein